MGLQRLNLILLISFFLFLSIGCSFDSIATTFGSQPTNTKITNEENKITPKQKLISPEQYTYKKINDTELKLYIYQPINSQQNGRIVVVFIHGGAWSHGSPINFERQAYYFQKRGIVAITVAYRLSNKHEITPFEALKDVKSAIRWIREHSDKLHINPNKIIVAGASAGGQLAAATAIIDSNNEASDNIAVSDEPNALVLFSPVLDMKKWNKILHVDLSSISPLQQIKKPLPPTIIFHGTQDHLAPFSTTESFVKKAQSLGSNNVLLVPYYNREHSFFTKNRGDNNDLTTTLQLTNDFIKNLGW